MINVIINHYWAKRSVNIKKILESLRKGSVRPDKIILFINNPLIEVKGQAEDIITIRSSYNFGYRAAYIASLLNKQQFYMIMDDDVMVEKDTLKNFMKYAGKNSVLGLWGKYIGKGDKPYKEHLEAVKSTEIDDIRKVDVLIGKGLMFFDSNCLENMISLENRILNKSADNYLNYDETREQDILMSMSNFSYVIPSGKDEGIKDLGEHGVGYNREKGHYEKRDNLVKLIKSL